MRFLHPPWRNGGECECDFGARSGEKLNTNVSFQKQWALRNNHPHEWVPGFSTWPRSTKILTFCLTYQCDARCQFAWSSTADFLLSGLSWSILALQLQRFNGSSENSHTPVAASGSAWKSLSRRTDDCDIPLTNSLTDHFALARRFLASDLMSNPSFFISVTARLSTASRDIFFSSWSPNITTDRTKFAMFCLSADFR